MRFSNVDAGVMRFSNVGACVMRFPNVNAGEMHAFGLHGLERTWMNLPDSFVKTFEDLLGKAEYAAFSLSLCGRRTWGLRVNTLKIGIDLYLARTPFSLEPVPWARDGFQHDGNASPGRHPDYHAGIFYLQDPSAMLPAELLDPQPGDRVLDLCAAPGGKSVQMAAMMRNRGLLVANDISPKRVKPLCRNLEGLGIACAVVLNETPDRLAKAFPGYFDKILIDAPCSGEGMFRKDDKAVRSWERRGPNAFLPLQRELLEAAWSMLRPGGRLVYATCTYNPDENERNIAQALDRFPDMSVEGVAGPASDLLTGLRPGRPDWAGNRMELSGAFRIWPHIAQGEGQFAVRLRKEALAEIGKINPTPDKGDQSAENGFINPTPDKGGQSGENGFINPTPDKNIQSSDNETVRQVPDRGRPFFQLAPADALTAWSAFLELEMSPEARVLASEMPIRSLGRIVLSGSMLFSLPDGGAVPASLHAEMPGLLLGEWRNDRFEPSAALLHALEPDSARRRLDLPAESDAIRRYLHGETLMNEGERGWTAVCADGYPLGWGKQEDGFLKNRYPKGWRMQ